MRGMTILTAIVLVALGLALGASAETKARVGTRINLFGGAVQTLPAGQPFHVSHGWQLQGGTPHGGLGDYGFVLVVDGVELREDFVDKTHIENEKFGKLQGRGWVFNSPAE
jgi:hypothetical protein